MKPQEAKELVKQCGLNIEGIKNIECESVIISALEKQIPKKVTFHKSHYRCPSCNDLIMGGSFCRYCGQALDWCDTNDR